MDKDGYNDTQEAYERGFIDGMQKQMQSSVDKAVNGMTHEDLAKIAKEAGCIPHRHPEYDNDVQVFATPDVLMQFAKLVIANNPPQSFMSWQEGYAAGAAAEREACAKVCEEGGRDGSGRIHVQAWGCAKAIRARGQE